MLLAQRRGRHLVLVGVEQLPLDAGDHRVNLFQAHGPFLDGLHDAARELR